MVSLDERWLVDVGFGDTCRRPVKIYPNTLACCRLWYNSRKDIANGLTLDDIRIRTQTKGLSYFWYELIRKKMWSGLLGKNKNLA